MRRWFSFHIACLAAMVMASAGSASATNVGTGLVDQLVFLGDDSRADRIPLAPAIFNANYNYGMFSAIFQPRPCLHGHFTGVGAPFYEQNLAVLYGIEAEFGDETQLPGSTLLLRLHKRTPPVNSPYTLEQVVAASIQCVLNQAGMLREDRALTVAIEADGMVTPEWAAKYAIAYFHVEKSGDAPERLAKVPGLRVEQSPLGDRAVVFESVDVDPAAPERRAVYVPFTPEGEAGDLEGIRFIPVWHGQIWNERLNVLARPLLPYYEKWGGGIGGRNIERVAVAHRAPPGFPDHTGPAFHVDRREDGTQVELLAGGLDPAQLAGFIFGCVLTERPTPGHPLTMIVPDYLLTEDIRAPIAADPAWKDGKSCEFVLDPETLTLAKGSVPGFTLRSGYGGLPVVFPKDAAEAQSP